VFSFEVRMGGVGYYDVAADARAEGLQSVRDRARTEVVGMSDVDLIVSERRRVLDVGEKTTFQIRLRNYGTKDAEHLLVKAQLSPNLKITGYVGGPFNPEPKANEKKDQAVLEFESLGRGKEIPLGLEVEVVGAEPKQATCRVTVTHDELTEGFEDMA